MSTQDMDIERLKKQIREELLEELKNEEKRKEEEAIKRKEEEKRQRKEYVDKMMASPNPWIDIIGMNDENPNQVKIELDWNDAFVNYLRENGITGTDDEQLVQHWLTMLLKDITEDLENAQNSEFE